MHTKRCHNLDATCQLAPKHPGHIIQLDAKQTLDGPYACPRGEAHAQTQRPGAPAVLASSPNSRAPTPSTSFSCPASGSSEGLTPTSALVKVDAAPAHWHHARPAQDASYTPSVEERLRQYESRVALPSPEAARFEAQCIMATMTAKIEGLTAVSESLMKAQKKNTDEVEHWKMVARCSTSAVNCVRHENEQLQRQVFNLIARQFGAPARLKQAQSQLEMASAAASMATCCRDKAEREVHDLKQRLHYAHAQAVVLKSQLELGRQNSAPDKDAWFGSAGSSSRTSDSGGTALTPASSIRSAAELCLPDNLF